MSGGSYDYLCFRVSETYEGEMKDAELNEMIVDLCEVLHDLEWWQSGDYGEDTYRETVKKFKDKWFGQTDQERLKKVADKAKKGFEELLNNTFGL